MNHPVSAGPCPRSSSRCCRRWARRWQPWSAQVSLAALWIVTSRPSVHPDRGLAPGWGCNGLRNRHSSAPRCGSWRGTVAVARTTRRRRWRRCRRRGTSGRRKGSAVDAVEPRIREPPAQSPPRPVDRTAPRGRPRRRRPARPNAGGHLAPPRVRRNSPYPARPSRRSGARAWLTVAGCTDRQARSGQPPRAAHRTVAGQAGCARYSSRDRPAVGSRFAPRATARQAPDPSDCKKKSQPSPLVSNPHRSTSVIPPPADASVAPEEGHRPVHVLQPGLIDVQEHPVDALNLQRHMRGPRFRP